MPAKIIENPNPRDPRTEGEEYLLNVFKTSRIFDGWQICYPNENNKIFDVIEHYRSRGHEMDRMEAYSPGFDDAKGFLDVDVALELFQNAQWSDYKKVVNCNERN